MFDYMEEHLLGFGYVETVISMENKQSLKSRLNMGFAIIGQANGFYHLKKDVDPAKAVKGWQDAKAQTVTIEPRKTKSAFTTQSACCPSLPKTC